MDGDGTEDGTMLEFLFQSISLGVREHGRS